MKTDPQSLPIRVDFACYRGDDWTRMLEPVTDDGPVDMTGWTGRMQIRDHVDGPIRLEASSANGRITTGPQSNSRGTTWQLMVYLSKGDTGGLPPRFVGHYDIELTKTDGKRTTWYYGIFRCEGDVTKEES